LEILKLVIRLARLHFLIPGFMIYILGYLLAISNGASGDITKFLFGYLILACAHVSVSFSNDYFDRKSDANSVHTTFSGGSRVLVDNPQLEKLALGLAIFFLVASATAILLFTLVFACSYWFVTFAILGGLLGWFYTAPPLKFAYRKLGEVVTVLAVGLMMPGIGYFVAYGSIDLFFAFFIFPLSCYGLLFILTVEMPDVENDRKENKINVFVKWGIKSGMYISFVSALAGTLSLSVFYFSGFYAGRLDLLPFILFSFIPLVGVSRGLFVDLNSRDRLTRQVMINMITIILFLFLVDTYMLVQFFT
jgi:1,4-dihydroxy-2-naphthoate polyprenyltransferase